MPGMTGLEVLEALEDEGLRTRVVLLTASATDSQIASAVGRGAWGIMLKESAGDDLLGCLRGVLAGERYLPPELVSPALAREAERQAATERVEDLLTAREREIATLVAEGLSNKQIARQVNISVGTVKIHLHNAYQKLGIPNRTALATWAARHWGTGGPRHDF
jgi:DNA-binding NarL/FixJ family response regulator